MNEVVFKDGVVDEKQESFEIRTARATYLYHKRGCGFSSLIDRDGNDWIGYTPKDGPKGNYRGIPNMALDEFAHPGYETGQSELLSESATQVHFRSSTPDGKWETEWRIHPTHAEMTAVRIGAPTWLLYEGAPGGRFDPAKQSVLFSDGTSRSGLEKWSLRTPEPKWISFCDPKTGRSLVFAYAGPESFPDTYWPFGGKGSMTVFGFGRTDEGGYGFHIRQVPFTFSFALVESTSFEEIAAYVAQYMPTGRG